ncbi:MAG: TetR/AcrR family transcriptional regulator [Phycisphaerae bacterium]
MATRSDGIETREKLLEAALDAFVNKGFHGAHVAEICRRAGANVAAVNYHFGGKLSLYAEVWKRAFQEADRRLPLDGGLPESAPPEHRLRALIHAVLSRILRHGARSRSGRLMLQEMAQPLPELHHVRMEATEPVRRRLRGIVSELLGPGVDEDTICRCCLSILHQVLAIGFRGGRKSSILGEGEFTDPEVDALIDHTVRFSLGGLQAIANETHPSVSAVVKGDKS